LIHQKKIIIKKARSKLKRKKTSCNMVKGTRISEDTAASFPTKMKVAVPPIH
jgi:hypothetical protein